MKSILSTKALGIFVTAGLFAWGAPETKADECPMHAAHQKEAASAAPSSSHFEGVDARGDEAMGFDHAKTAHHFRLSADGGTIEVEANNASDTASRDAIRTHLAFVAAKFSDGAFDLPMFIHDTVPPGVPVMKEKSAAIAYSFEPTARGGRVRITTRDGVALASVHAFLKFQIRDHRTGDPTELSSR